jgi:hypothetical protein
MKKRLDAEAITNELKGNSVYFQRPLTPLSRKDASLVSTSNTRTSERTNERTDERVNTRTLERANERTSERAGNTRKIVRYSFQFYADQITELKRLRAQKELNGETGDLSQLAREAIDAYLKRTSERTNE